MSRTYLGDEVRLGYRILLKRRHPIHVRTLMQSDQTPSAHDQAIEMKPHSHSITNDHSVNALSDCHDYPRRIRPEDSRVHVHRGAGHLDLPVDGVDPSSFDADEDFAWAWSGYGRWEDLPGTAFGEDEEGFLVGWKGHGHGWEG